MQEVKIEELETALNYIAKINRYNLNETVWIYPDGKVILPSELASELEDFKFAGLNNKDFYIYWLKKNE